MRASEERLAFQARLLDAIGEAVIATALDGTILYWNPAAERLYGRAATSVLGRNVLEVTVSDTDGSQTAELMRVLARTEQWTGLLHGQRSDGTPIIVELTCSPVFDANGRLTGKIGISSDVTAREEATARDTTSRQLLADAERVAGLGSWEWNLVTDTVIWSDGMFRIFGLDRTELISTFAGVAERLHPDDVDLLRATVTHTMAVREPFRIRLRTRPPADGSTRWIEATGDFASTADRMVGTVLDITERVRVEEELARLALQDALTGLPNRMLLTDRLVQALQRSIRTQSLIGVLFVEIDRLQLVNDSLGHAAGDAVLITMAERIRQAVRPADTVGRFGGDIFAVVCEGLVSGWEATVIAARITSAVEQPLDLEQLAEVRLTASIGVAISAAGDSAESVLSAADAAMARAKEKGRARTEVFEEGLRERAGRRFATEHAMRRGIDTDQFTLLYQPIVALHDGTVVGAEALVRWMHPDQGMISPAEFIPLAEDTGLIVQLGERVLTEACRQLAEWTDKAPTMSMSVNLSMRQLLVPDLLTSMKATIDQAGVDPARLTLELTESSLMEDVDFGLESLLGLKALGVSLAVDDFGTGYSSLSYLKRFPVDTLKIDRSFLVGLGRDPHDAAIVGAVVAMARAMSLDVVAEGVETSDQLAGLRALGCPHAQGYHFARPLAPDAFAELLVEGRSW